MSAAAALEEVREEYFSHLARYFPTLCLHDEFIFFPRVAAAWSHWWQVARLEAADLHRTVGRMAALLARLERLPSPGNDPELTADLTLLRQSLRSVLRELGPGGPWQWDPFLYLKVASLALAPVLAQAPHLQWRDQEKVAALLRRVARLLEWGRIQVLSLSRPGAVLAPGVFADARRFFQETVPTFLTAHFSGADAFRRPLQEMLHNLERFRETVVQLPATPAPVAGEAGLAAILSGSWGWTRDLDTTAVILREEKDEAQEALAQLAARIKPGLSWREVLQTWEPPPGRMDLLNLYRREVARLWAFWDRSRVLPRLQGRVEVAPTPVYLQSLRSSASYAAPWGNRQQVPGYFYITPGTEDFTHHWQHHRFLSAHETVPGHHFLDAARLSLSAPLRRQYESPLFYEGWASYAETLLISEGYLDDPRELLVGWQRRLWRALRGLVDLELQRGRIDLDEGLAYLGEAGYPEPAVRLQILHLALNPGYQLCYTIGMKELLRLQARFAPALGPARFHEVLLAGGQLPFDLVEDRLRQASSY